MGEIEVYGAQLKLNIKKQIIMHFIDRDMTVAPQQPS